MRLLISLFFLISCQKLPVISEIKGNYKLLNQDSSVVNFPLDYKGKKLIVGFIYTHCPDICPIITENMVKLSKKTNEKNLLFVLISFDWQRDKPSVLKKYATIRELDFNNWVLLTGEEAENLIKEFNVVAIKQPTNIDTIYFITHTDRISLVDSRGRIRKNYKGSELNIDEVLSDIKKVD